MARPPRCEVNGCENPKFYTNGPHCLQHINNPPTPTRQPARRSETSPPAEESESSD